MKGTFAISDEFGRGDFFVPPPPATTVQKWVLVSLICFFILSAFAADLWPCKKTYFFFGFQGIRPYTMLNQISLAMRYSHGGSADDDQSLMFLSVLKIFSSFIPSRLLCLRTISILAATISLILAYRLVAILFSRPIALLFISLLVTSPIYLESMRAFGFHSVSYLMAIVVCYLTVSSLNNRRVIGKMIVLALAGFTTLSLYIMSRLVIFVPVIFFGIYLRQYWSRLVLFLLLIVFFITLFDGVLGDCRFNWNAFVTNPPEGWIAGGESFQTLLDERYPNFSSAVNLLFNRGRTIFLDEDSRSSFFNKLYTPFLFLGLIISLVKHKPSNLFMLALIVVFLFVPLFSESIPPRRILFSLYPMYLFIALGLWYFFQLICRRLRAGFPRVVLIGISALILTGIAGYNIHSFFFRVSRPYYNYTQEQLKEVAEFIIDWGREADMIKYNRPTRDLIWGNPYFSDSPEALWLGPRIRRDLEGPPPQWGLKNNLEYALKRGKSLLYLYTYPYTTHVYGTGDYKELFADIKWAEDTLTGRITVAQLPGTDLHYVYLSTEAAGLKIPFSKPDDMVSSRSNALTGEGAIVTVSSYIWRCNADKLVDNDESTYWRTSSHRLDSSSYIMVDFGPGKARKITYLAALSRTNRPEEFLRRAELFGSRDRTSWKEIVSIHRDEPFRLNQWYERQFENNRSYRYYKLLLYDTFSSLASRFYSLAELRMSE